ncbi:MAG: AAA family ATPase, partial [Micrococcales bacterium]|nr:AAA family ATPase [Micrococcales bacterium]
VDQRQAGYDPREELYCPLDDKGVRGTDSRDLMAGDIEFTVGGATLVFGGPRGSGKSSELLRMGRDFEAQGRVFLYADAEEYLSRHEPLDDGALLVAIAAGLVDAVQKRDAKAHVKLGSRFLDVLNKFKLGDTTVGVDIGPVTLSQVIRPDLADEKSGVRDRIKKLMTNNRRVFRDALHAVIAEAVDLLQADPGKPPVFVFDSLDHWRGTASNYAAVRESIDLVFQETARELQLPNLNVVYAVPPHVDPGWCPRHFLYNVKVADEAGAALNDGIRAMREVLERRAPGSDLNRLLDDTALNIIIGASGGHFRTLMRLMTLVTLIVRHDRLPASPAHVADAMGNLRDALTTSMTAEQRHILQAVEKDRKYVSSEDDLYAYDELESSGAILRYRNGGWWLAVHPLVKS